MLTPSQCEMLRIISENPGASHLYLREKYHFSTRSMTYRAIHHLHEIGLIRNGCGDELREKSAGNWWITSKGVDVLSHISIIDHICREVC